MEDHPQLLPATAYSIYLQLLSTYRDCLLYPHPSEEVPCHADKEPIPETRTTEEKICETQKNVNTAIITLQFLLCLNHQKYQFILSTVDCQCENLLYILVL
jgi:hypothetical protein